MLSHSALPVKPKANFDKAIRRIVLVPVLACLALLLSIFLFQLKESLPFFQSPYLSTLLTNHWYPSDGEFGLWPMVVASTFITVGALCIAVPLGLGSAIYLCYVASEQLSKLYYFMLALFAGMPSVIFGLWGLTEIVPLLATLKPPGTSLLAASLVLAFMILPTVALTSYAALSAVPKDMMAAAMALGLRLPTRVLFIAIPAARAGIISGAVLAFARALGETMVVLMISGNVVQVPGSLFDSVRALTANIALEMAYAMDAHRASLFATGLVLTLVVFVLVSLAYWQSEKAATQNA